MTGKPYRHIEGQLDDGSVGRWLYRAHDDCYQLSVSDSNDEDGCFTFGGTVPLRHLSSCARAAGGGT